MPTTRVLTFAVPIGASDTHFNVQFRATAAATWTNYSTASATPTDPFDLAVALLDADENYTLDGINSPSGNEETASSAGNEYRHRLKSAGGYSNWSPVFRVGDEPDSDGPRADLAQIIQEFALIGVEFDLDAGEEVDALLSRILTEEMDRLRVTETIGTLYTGGAATSAQVRLLGVAERYGTVAALLESSAALKAMGLHAPLLVEDSESVLAVAEYYRGKAKEIVKLLEASVDADEGPNVLGLGTLSTTELGPHELYREDLVYGLQ